MKSDARLWREASVAPDLGTFLGRLGADLIDDLDLDVLAIRTLDDGGAKLDLDAFLRRGAVGVAHPDVPRAPLRATAAGAVREWIRRGEVEQVGRGHASAAVRELLRGVGRLEDGGWIVAPLVAHDVALGALIGQLARGVTPDRRRLASVAEAIAVVVHKDQAQRALARQGQAAEADRQAALARLHVRDISPAVIGADTGLREVMAQVAQVAPTAAPVLIFGETGSGKEVVARTIHERSARAAGPILRVNCGAIPPELVDSELFGHERGSFTGATAQRQGWFERADGGTLFLDEVAELPLAAQVRLLRVLQDGVFERVGGGRAVEVDVRIVAATHRDLADMARRGAFREDLWYRINVFTVRLPPLRERQGDIAALAAHFAAQAARRVGARALEVSAEDVADLQAYPWPGNVRELAAVIERAAILGEGRRLEVRRALGGTARPAPTSAGRVAQAPAAPGDDPSLAAAIRAHIAWAVAHCEGRIDGPRGAARLLAINPSTLRSKMKRLGMA